MMGKMKKNICFRKSVKHAAAISLLVFAVVLSGCATRAKVKEDTVPAPVDIYKGPAVERLSDGQMGFAIKENPVIDSDSRSEFDRALSLMVEGKYDKAAELFEGVSKRSPDFSAPHINAGVCYMHLGKMDKAEGHLKSALAIIPGHPVASNEYGLLLRKSGRFKDAREAYEKSIAAFPDYLPLHRNLGILCDLYLNDPSCALKEFTIYSKGTPDDAKVKIWIDELGIRLGKKQ